LHHEEVKKEVEPVWDRQVKVSLKNQIEHIKKDSPKTAADVLRFVET
jgi:hypothetical protein